MAQKINILVRKSRPEGFEKLIASIDHDVNVIVHDDTAPREKEPFDYNLFCNSLKAQVEDGYFLFADDDDYFAPGALAKLQEHLTQDPHVLIVQFLRKNNNGFKGWDVVKPTDQMIKQGVIKMGMIGGGCAVVHSSFKDVADWKAVKGADFFWIKEMQDKGVPFRFLNLVLQISENKGNGR